MLRLVAVHHVQKAKLTVVSSTSIVEGGSHDVVLKNATPNIING